jgi:endo-1,3-1,4-beta-glycanase ExoK
MAMKYLFGLLALFACSPAHADPIPFLDDTRALNTKDWYVSGSQGPIVNGADWNACTWVPGNVLTNPHLEEVDLLITKNPDNSGSCILPTPYTCGELQTQLFHSYGTYSVRMKAAAGKGLNSAFFTYTGPTFGKPHDEIDFEFLGKYPTQVSLNWWKNDISSPVNGKQIWGKVVNLGFDASKDFHDYSFTWTPTSITWFIDGKQVYTTPAGAGIPVHQQKIYIDFWASAKGSYPWMGTLTYTGPLTAEYQSVSFTPYVAPAPATSPAALTSGQ